jgi:signal transduction histidine kinase/ligand-binding sensor domain-containing protein
MARSRHPAAWLGAGLTLALSTPTAGEQLSIRTYRPVDGLTTGYVAAIHQDRRGYLWFGTGDGLSRFDGRRFVRYGVPDGLPIPAVSGIAEDASGRLWVATYPGGLARLDDSASPLFRSFAKTADVLAVSVADDGTVYWLSEAGLHRGRETGSGLSSELLLRRPVIHDAVRKPLRCRQPFRDSNGRLWIGLADGVVSVTSTGWSEQAPPAGQRGQPVLGLARLDDTSLVAVYPNAAFRLTWPEGAEPHWSPVTQAPAGLRLTGAIALTPDGSIHLGTDRGLLREVSGVWHRDTRDSGLPEERVNTLGVDAEGGLWIGGDSSVSRIGRSSWSLSAADGLPEELQGIVQGIGGRIYAIGTGMVEIAAGQAVPVPGSRDAPFRNVGRRVLCDRRGRWWVGTDEALHRFDGPELRLRNGRRFGVAEGLPSGVGRHGLYEDDQGVLWVANREGQVYRMDSDASDRPSFRRLPPRRQQTPVWAMAQDASGALWVSDLNFLSRFDGTRWTVLAPGPGLPGPSPRALLCDHRGRLWLGFRFNGVSVSEEPRAPSPRFRNYTEHDGLLSDAVRALAEDAQGRVYVGTARGVSRLDPESGAWRHFVGPADSVERLLVDAGGGLWVVTTELTRFEAAGRDEPRPDLRTYVTRLRVAGADVPLPARGIVTLPELSVPASGDVAFEFTSPLFDTEARYQYRLEGAGDSGWSPLQREAAVNYARLAPGRYRFSVRALDVDGRPGSTPAVVPLRVLAPLWRRPWFQAAAGLLLAGLAFGGYRMRVRRLLALERLRRQIATDLHDDVGSGLTEIAVLSEVVRRDPQTAPARMEGIAGLARSLRESMSDIVWAVDPRRDRLSDMVDRMRQVAFNLAEADGIRVDFDVPSDVLIARIGLTPDQKRHLLLVFKEAMNNLARHSGARHARVLLEVQRGHLVLAVRDDGHGFDPSAPTSGLGLTSLRRRAVEMGGSLDIASAAGEGTTLRLHVPLRS